MPDAAELTGRRAEVYERLTRAEPLNATEIANELGITRNAVYQHIGRLKAEGYVPDDNGGAPPRQQLSSRAARAARDERAGVTVMDEVEQLTSRMRARLAEIDEQARELTREREQITHLLERLAPVEV